MKRAVTILLSVLAFAGVAAQECPPEWVGYTYGGYLYDIQSDRNVGNIPEAEFKNRLLDMARTNLARQIEVRVRDVAELRKSVVNGRSSVAYESETAFFTDVDLKLVETRTLYRAESGEAYAMAYISREAARNYYRNELTRIINKVDGAMTLAENHISAGFKSRAREALNGALSLLGDADEPIFRLNIFGAPNALIEESQSEVAEREIRIKALLDELQHGTVVYLNCRAEIFGKPYPSLQNELKGVLATGGCSFTQNPAEADWVITVDCTTRRYAHNVTGGVDTYFAFVDACITVDKNVASQRTYEDEISVKGGHTASFDEAARTAYKDAKKQLGNIITQNIEQ